MTTRTIEDIQTITACRSCGHEDLVACLNLGSTPLANRLICPCDETDDEPRYPLELVFCPNCALTQIRHTVAPHLLFSRYVYFSSYSQTALDNARDIVQRMIRDQQVGPDSLAMELASNDGYLLQYYREAGVPVLGIEPAGNIAQIARERGIDTRCLFFNKDAATALKQEGVAADVLHANNVLAHVADLHSFVAGIAIVLKPTGIAVIEVPYLCDMISGGEFDTIYHEHLCYFSLIALRSLMARHGLAIVDVEHLPIHGGSLRLFIRHTTTQTSASDSVDQMIAEEQALGIDRINYYHNFAREVETLRDQLTALLQQRKQQGRRIVAYGASAKGSTLLNCFGIGRNILDYIVDRNDHKQGQLAPGTHLPIVHPDQLLTDQPDDVLLLTWNFRDEILAQQAEYRRRGGRFIIPIPKLEIV